MKLALNNKTLIAVLVFTVFGLASLAMASSALATNELQEFISEEVGQSAEDPGQEVDEQDDEWRDALIGSGVDGSDIEYATSTAENEGDEVTTLETDQGTTLTLSLQNIDQPLDDPSDTGTANGTQGTLGPVDQNTLAGQAPKPAQAVEQAFYDQGRRGGTSSRNGLLIDFSDPVAAFGAWFGDLETSSSTPALLRVFDTEGNLIDDQVTITTSTDDETVCEDSSTEGCGNNTTRWVGFIAPDDQPAGSVLTIVGDDNGDGNREALSAIGFSVLLHENLPVGSDDDQITQDDEGAAEDEGETDDQDTTVDQPVAQDPVDVTTVAASDSDEESTDHESESEQVHSPSVLGNQSIHQQPALAATGVGGLLSLIVSSLIMLSSFACLKLVHKQ